MVSGQEADGRDRGGGTDHAPQHELENQRSEEHAERQRDVDSQIGRMTLHAARTAELMPTYRLRCRSTRLICSSTLAGTIFMLFSPFGWRCLAGVVVAISTERAGSYRSQKPGVRVGLRSRTGRTTQALMVVEQ